MRYGTTFASVIFRGTTWNWQSFSLPAQTSGSTRQNRRWRPTAPAGMKAALNGVPSLSVLDGWWIEGYIEDATGWSIGKDSSAVGQPSSRQNDAASLYDTLEHAVIPTFYQDRGRFVEMMRHCIALNGSFFNTHRMLQQYILKAYYAWAKLGLLNSQLPPSHETSHQEATASKPRHKATHTFRMGIRSPRDGRGRHVLSRGQVPAPMLNL
jgi:hypothetical protein